MSSYQKFTFNGALTLEQIDFFNAHGFIHFEHYASEETVQAIIASTEAVQEQWVARDLQKSQPQRAQRNAHGGTQRLGVGSQKSGVRSKKLEVRSRKFPASSSPRPLILRMKFLWP